MLEVVFQNLYRWGLLGSLILAAGVSVHSCGHEHDITKLKSEVAARDKEITALRRSNESMDATITRLIDADVRKQQLWAEKQKVVERHYIREREVTAKVEGLEQERKDAGLEDGPLSPDLKFVLRGLRRLAQERNAETASRDDSGRGSDQGRPPS